MNRRGSVPLLAAGMMVAFVGAAGVAVDTGRAWLVEARLKSALDAAGLTAARRISEPNRDTEATAVFWANLTQGGRSANYLGATISNPVITVNPATPDLVRISATAQVPSTLFSVIGGSRNIAISDFTVGRRAGTGLELAIAIDQTGSMAGSKIAAAKSAATTMLDILYAGRDTQNRLFVSIVPFSRTINIGPNNSGMLDTSGMPASWSLANWTGCVEARRPAFELTDDAPTGDGRFRPFFWPSTFRQVGSVEGNRCQPRNAYAAVTVNGVSTRFCHGDNDWFDFAANRRRTEAELRGTDMPNAENTGNDQYVYLRSRGFSHDEASGPNMLCAQTPILPLTARRSVVQAHLDSVNARVHSGGTLVSAGLQGAWYTLSPAWRGFWQETNAGVPGLPPLPHAYNAPNMRKAVVILTDGDNNWQRPYNHASADRCGHATGRGVCSSATGTELIYSAYGRISAASGGWNARFPTNQISAPASNLRTTAEARLDSRLLATCAAMKAQGIVIYIVGFEVATEAHRTLLRTCSSGEAYYFETPTAADLARTFSRIANQLVSLSLAQ